MQGFFSAELNTQCQICPAGAVSSQGSFGINGCNCPSGKYIEYWKYSSSPYIPPAKPAMSRDLECLPCTAGGICTQMDADGELVSTYPYPLPGYWQPPDNIEYQSVTWKGQTIQTPIDDGPKALYDCPFSSCLGGLETNCSAGYHGLVCGICESGHELTTNGCKECSGAGSYVILMILCAFLVPIGLCGLYVGSIIQGNHIFIFFVMSFLNLILSDRSGNNFFSSDNGLTCRCTDETVVDKRGCTCFQITGLQTKELCI